jgi:pyranose oxidase
MTVSSSCVPCDHALTTIQTHWTCATPRFHNGEKVRELPQIIKDDAQNAAEWDRLYTAAEKFIGTSEKEFDESIRHNLVLRTLDTAYNGDAEPKKRIFKPLPLACHRLVRTFTPYVNINCL